jgi:hypothetical protein
MVSGLPKRKTPGAGPGVAATRYFRRRYCSAAVFMPNVTVAWNTTALPENAS